MLFDLISRPYGAAAIRLGYPFEGGSEGEI